MQSLAPQKSESVRYALASRVPCTLPRNRPRFPACLVGFFGVLVVPNIALAAQTPTTPVLVPVHPYSQLQKKPSAATIAAKPCPASAAPVPAASQIANWPANNKPDPASIVWDSNGLFIQASNSSLNQILREVSFKTGAAVEGIGADERIFGTYGPGPARQVLGELLDGSPYNVLMVGDLGQGTPRRIVLSNRPAVQAQPNGNVNPGPNNENNTESDQDSEQSQTDMTQPMPMPPPGANGLGPAVPVRSTRQQMLEERQRMLMQMRQQQQPNQEIPQN